ncbi:vitamin K epoxide reductase family protein [Tumidithrix elongata RA019]|uniref:Vitamin K epoxide reductase family protein n=1 Tax=Tumidithrix elongata BACA0141 TaxID=2716417 RepID=A0AAW9PWW6_9CYAN|nr:vitamin K epoxide reductase family protein [Tumidithrix elongata RA019]
MRQRSEPWINRWYRPIIIAITIFGAALTSYLTITHFFGGTVALCTTQGSGCDLILNSEYAKIFGIPLTIFGALGYLTIGGLAAAPLIFQTEDVKFKEKVKQQTSFLLFMVSTATMVFSAYLMYLVAFVIKDANGQTTFCIYCFSSAMAMFSIWLLNLFGNIWKDIGQLIFIGLIVGVVTLTGTLGVYASQNQLLAQSGTFQGRLVQHLRAIDAKMYGAFWCPHCRDQKELFGEAKKQIPYIECDPRGENPKTQLCQAKGIKGFPTWEIKNKLHEGQKTLEELADLSGYEGSRAN